MATTQSATPTQRTGRKSVDCRLMPSESNCTLKISGKPDEVLRAAKQHAISVHGHQDSPELEESIKAAMRDERD